MMTYFGVRDGGGKVHRETWSLQRGYGGWWDPAPHQKHRVVSRTVHGNLRPDYRQVCTPVQPSEVLEEGKRVYSQCH